MKIGIMFGNPETTAGGNALKFYASQRLDVRKTGTNKDGEEVISSKTRIKCVKNKVAPPFKECELDIVYGKGIDVFTDTINLAVEANIVEKSGSWYSYQGTKIGQGMEKVKDFLTEHPEIFEEITTKVLG
jgi:recombination protein RecA